METYRVHSRHPSFSSSLLDHIYRSIDDSPSLESPTNHHHRKDRENSPDFEISRRSITTTAVTADSLFLRYSNSSSSDSSGFFSSESDSFYGRSKSSTFPPKPIRTSFERFDHSVVHKPNVKQELGGFRRTKSKALKIYTDLKKVKQPISPGGRLATFLNSLFTNSTGSPKKPKKTSTAASETQSAKSSSTTCSSASSFSRSCLSKTPSSSGKSKRSVRFCPVNVILDQDSSIHMPCDYTNNLYDSKRDVMEENRRVIEVAKDLLRTYHKNKDHMAVTTTTKCDDIINIEDDDDDDAASYASSDLFELENLSAIGIEKYQEELPVIRNHGHPT